MLFGNHHSCDAQFAQCRLHLFAVRSFAFGALTHMVERAGVGEASRDCIAQHLLVLRQSEIHQAAPCFWRAATAAPCSAGAGLASLGSRGISRPRSAMMFFWICAVPPPMIRPSWNM